MCNWTRATSSRQRGNPNKIDINGPRTFEGSANGRNISGFYKEVNGEKIISTWWIKN
jgi:hypothetical protein